MSTQRCEQFIAGKFVPSESGEYFPLINPENGEIAAEIARSTPPGRRGRRRCGKPCRKALLLAHSYGSFASPPCAPWPRSFGRICRAFVEAECRVTGRPIREMRAQLGRLPEWYDYFASIAETLEDSVPPFGRGYLNYTRREPLGVVGLLTPWNHPLLILTKKLAPALAAGNAVVIKPSELAPLTINMLAERMAESGIPEGIVNVVHGFGAVAGKALAENKKLAKVDLTGGTATGRSVAAAAGHNLVKVSAELGGKTSVIVFDDADFTAAVNGTVFAGYIAAGQTCVQGARVLVSDKLYDRFAAAFVEKVRKLRVGPPMDNRTDIGPLISQRQREQVLSWIEIGIREGATLACGGNAVPGPGWYVNPTVFTNVTNDMAVAQEEIFGPVVCLMRYRSEEEAIDLANGTQFGLGMGIWTNDIRRAHRRGGATRSRRDLDQRSPPNRSRISLGRLQEQRNRAGKWHRLLQGLHPDQERNRENDSGRF